MRTASRQSGVMTNQLCQSSDFIFLSTSRDEQSSSKYGGESCEFWTQLPARFHRCLAEKLFSRPHISYRASANELEFPLSEHLQTPRGPRGLNFWKLHRNSSGGQFPTPPATLDRKNQNPLLNIIDRPRKGLWVFRMEPEVHEEFREMT